MGNGASRAPAGADTGITILKAAPASGSSGDTNEDTGNNPVSTLSPEQLGVMSVTAGQRDARLPVSRWDPQYARQPSTTNHAVKSDTVEMKQMKKFTLSIVVSDKSCCRIEVLDEAKEDEAKDDEAKEESKESNGSPGDTPFTFTFSSTLPCIVTAALDPTEVWSETPAPRMRLASPQNATTKLYPPGEHTYTANLPPRTADKCKLGVMVEAVPTSIYQGARAAFIDEEVTQGVSEDAGTPLMYEEYRQVWDDVSEMPQFANFVPESKTLYFDLLAARQPAVTASLMCCNLGVHKTKTIFGMDEVTEDDVDNDENLCVICLCEPKCVAVKPCMHFCMCEDCAAMLPKQQGGCPVCRGAVVGFVKIEEIVT